MRSIQTVLISLVVLAASAATDDHVSPYRKEELPPYRSPHHRASTLEDEYSNNRRDTFRRYYSTTTTTMPPVSQKEYDDVKGLLDRVEDELSALKTNMTFLKGNLSSCLSSNNVLRNMYDGHKRDYEELKRENAKEIQKSATQFNNIVELKMKVKNLEHQLDAERNNLSSSLRDCNEEKKNLSDQLDAAENENNEFRTADAFHTEDCQMLNDTLNELEDRISDKAISEDYQKCLDNVADLEKSSKILHDTIHNRYKEIQNCQKSLEATTSSCSAVHVEFQNTVHMVFLFCIIAAETAFLLIIMVVFKVYRSKKNNNKAQIDNSFDNGQHDNSKELQMNEVVCYRL